MGLAYVKYMTQEISILIAELSGLYATVTVEVEIGELFLSTDYK